MKASKLDKKTFEMIDRISKEHCNNVFGYLNKDDLKNEIWIICLERLKFFKGKRGKLEHFLRVTVKNRLINRFKDVTKSVRSPCPRCEFYKENRVQPCTRYNDAKDQCKKWQNYQLSIVSRNSLLNSAEQQQERCLSDNILTKLSANEMKEIVRKNLPIEYKHDFEKLERGEKICQQDMKKLRTVIYDLLIGLGYEV